MKAEFYIQKTLKGGLYYLSPKKRRWLPIKSTKHKFGKFSEAEALDFMKLKTLLKPTGDFTLVPIEPTKN